MQIQIHLDTFQKNNLLVGNQLATEIASSSPELRAFVVIGAYTLSRPHKPSKYLNKSTDDVRFWIRRYEVDKAKIEEYITHDDLVASTYVRDIKDINGLEKELGKYIDDFSAMKPEWYVDNPLRLYNSLWKWQNLKTENELVRRKPWPSDVN